MLAVVYHGPKDLRVEEVPLPEIGPGELLVRVKGAGICGTDLRIYHGGHRKYPPGSVRIPGHEAAGTIAATGPGVSGYTERQAVFIAPNMGCGHCRECITGNNNRCPNYQAIGVTLDGAFAEYLRVPAAAVSQGNVIPLEIGVDPASAALIEPFACVLRGQRALGLRPGDTTLVMGAGPIGLMHARLARVSGAAKVIVSEPAPDRLAQAASMGVDRAVNPEQEDLAQAVAEETGGNGVDVVIVAAPSPKAQEDALHLAGIGGRINFFGGLPKDRPTIQFDTNLVHYKELIVTATTACSTADCRRAAEIVNAGLVDLSSLVSRRFILSEALAAFAAAESGRELKVVLEP